MPSHPFVSYAVNHEDVVLARALLPGTRHGVWIDVGAGHPVLGSMTAAFAERGWHGVNIEPLKTEYQQLCEARPSDVNLQIALGESHGIGKLLVGPTDYRARFSRRRGALAN